MAEAWEQEVLFGPRWGQHGEKAAAEAKRLKKLLEAAGPLDEPHRAIADQITALEICNWNLEGSIMALCEAMGSGRPATMGIGHLASISEDRWKAAWAYYLALRDWLPSQGRSGHGALLSACDPTGTTGGHVAGLLGERTELKELYVERFALTLEYWLGGLLPEGSPQLVAHRAATSAVEAEIRERDPESEMLGALEGNGDGALQPCHHKAFRRYDIVVSSIGAGRWRAAMPMRGTDGFERAALLERYLAPIEAWAAGPGDAATDETAVEVAAFLGERDGTKVFLASLLASLLRAQQLAATQRAERRAKKS